MHLMIEGVGGNPQRLFVNADYYIPKYLRKMVSLAGMTPISDVDFHQSPGSSAGIILLAESHASLHAQQEQGMTFIDLFTCKPLPDGPSAVLAYTKEFFAFKAMTHNTIHRGLEFQPAWQPKS